ncbi:MAG: Ppx/GppA family phosphatase [Alphaproteobacteria bacterium]|nr:Ppx/GppA family phosphatase [Alphaproteobacteria bacterium]
MNDKPLQSKQYATASHANERAKRESNVGEVYAALDLGTNNCRLLVAKPYFQQHTQHKTLKVVDSYSRIVRLGEGVSESGILSEEAMKRTIKALATCKVKLQKYPVAKSRFVATEACRRAKNAEEFLGRVEKELGLKVDIISNEEEARLAFLGCSSLLHKDTRYALAFDIGGGSTEFMWVKIDPEQPMSAHKRHLIQDWLSLPYGVMNMSEQFGGPAYTEMYFEEIVAKISELLVPIERENQIASRMWKENVQMLSTSGTVTTLAAIHLDLPHYDRSKIDGIKLSVSDIRGATQSLMRMSHAERAAHPCIGAARTDFILSGCAIFEAIARTFPIDKITIADRGVREGIIVSLMRETHA